jgi:hypothetical protein
MENWLQTRGNPVPATDGKSYVYEACIGIPLQIRLIYRCMITLLWRKVATLDVNTTDKLRNIAGALCISKEGLSL